MAGGFAGVFGEGTAARQLLLWGVANQLIAAAADPLITALTQDINDLAPLKELSPADLADMVVRGIVQEADAIKRGRVSGYDTTRMTELVESAGDAPAPELLSAAYRRGIIDWDQPKNELPSALEGIRRGRLRTEWADLFRQMSVQPPSPAEVLDALLKGQNGKDDTVARYIAAGGDPTYFDIAFGAAGESPTPDIAAEMARRGIIPWEGKGRDVVSYEQAFLEGRWRNKWAAAIKAVTEYHPPPRTVTAMLREGAYTPAQALAKFKASGLSDSDAQAYLNAAQHQRSQKARDLTETQLVQLYEARLIDPAQATHGLEALGYDAANAAFLLALADLRRSITQVNSAVSRVRSLYIGHKITRQSASSSLTDLKIPASQVEEILNTWDVERRVNVPALTVAEITAAWANGILDQAQAAAQLENLGWTALDAWIILSNKNKGPLPGKPRG